MEPFIIVDSVTDRFEWTSEAIYKTSQAESHTNTTGNTIYLYLFNNIEQDCAITLIIVGDRENYVIPSNTYYMLDETVMTHYLYNICFFYKHDSPLVRTINLNLISLQSSTLYIKNMNVRAISE